MDDFHRWLNLGSEGEDRNHNGANYKKFEHKIFPYGISDKVFYERIGRRGFENPTWANSWAETIITAASIIGEKSG